MSEHVRDDNDQFKFWERCGYGAGAVCAAGAGMAMGVTSHPTSLNMSLTVLGALLLPIGAAWALPRIMIVGKAVRVGSVLHYRHQLLEAAMNRANAGDAVSCQLLEVIGEDVHAATPVLEEALDHLDWRHVMARPMSKAGKEAFVIARMGEVSERISQATLFGQRPVAAALLLAMHETAIKTGLPYPQAFTMQMDWLGCRPTQRERFSVGKLKLPRP
jgi:hypothetical protein